jgi:hypothetical protein
MHISLESKLYLGTCIVAGVYNAYQNPVRWITTFAIGLLIGTSSGRSDLKRARDGDQPGNNMGMGYDEVRDKEIKKEAVLSLASSMPGIVTTAINLLAFGLISKQIQLPSQINPQVGTYFCDFATWYFGYKVGRLFQLEALRGNTDSDIQKQLDQTTI